MPTCRAIEDQDESGAFNALHLVTNNSSLQSDLKNMILTGEVILFHSP